jgi:hypothetical protein
VATAPNLGTGGSVLDAQFGSSSTSNTNEPLALAHTGVNYLYLPGVTDSVTTPDAAPLRITGDIECVARVALDDWSPAANAQIVARDESANRSYQFIVTTTGAMRIVWSSDGTTVTSNTSSADLASTANGTALWLRWRFDVDNGASGRTATYWWAADQATEPTSWTQLGTDVTQAGVTSIFAGTAKLAIGGAALTSTPMVGKVYGAIVRNGIGGTTVLDANFTTGITSGGQTSFTESSSNAATVTINRSTSGRKAVAVVRPVWLLGTDDFFQVADNDLLDFGTTDSFTLVAVVRDWSTSATLHSWIAKKTAVYSASSAGYWLGRDTGSAAMAIADGTAQATDLQSISAGALMVASLTRDIATGTIAARVNGTGTTASGTGVTATLANSEVMRIGRLSGAGTSYADMELLAAMVFRRALTAAELSAIAAYYGI